jgi:hypothetical protein
MFRLHRLCLPTPPEGVPNAYWKGIARMRTAIAFFLFTTWTVWVSLGVATVISPTWVISAPDGALLLLVAGSVAVVCVCRGACRRSSDRFCAAVSRSSCQLCLNCGYSLRGLPKSHICPECGVGYDIESVRRKWERWLSASGMP